ncbi:MFS transporter [Lutispora thermophila]|uniref:MFS transporter, DHA3 family, tetracycline resistance protein n=1 Tax=Lutispora thermophila DSM 19022 TaxID=1122184 RepID=A0A1M6EIR5_9FIRM|nr:MFS transporter [Lutispora thermophila]SHI85387.1 MFS transporter, DHA3 family, tetracycline resistance protein [Lutispora thermophila DSM 19022]
MAKKLSAYRIYLIYAGVTAFLFDFVFTVNQLYRIEVAGLDAMQLVLVGTALELSCFLFEVPTGLLADIKSRKLSVIIGLILIGLGFLAESLVTDFWAILLCQIIWGFGYTFTSGADEAWIADKLGGKNLEQLFLKGAQIGQIGALLAIIASTIMGTIMISLPMAIGGISFILLGLFLIAFMPETAFHKTPLEDRNSFQQMFHTLDVGFQYIRKSPFLIVMLMICLFYGLYSEGLDRLWIAHMLDNRTLPSIDMKPVIWVGVIKGLSMIISICAVEYIKRVLRKTGKLQKAWLLILINFMMVATIIAFGLARNFVMAFSAYMSFYIIRTINDPIYRAWLNENIDSKARATVLSAYTQIDSFGQILSGPLIGFIAYKTNTAMSIIASGLILSPVVALYFYLLRIGLHT